MKKFEKNNVTTTQAIKHRLDHFLFLRNKASKTNTTIHVNGDIRKDNILEMMKNIRIKRL